MNAGAEKSFDPAGAVAYRKHRATVRSDFDLRTGPGPSRGRFVRYVLEVRVVDQHVFLALYGDGRVFTRTAAGQVLVAIRDILSRARERPLALAELRESMNAENPADSKDLVVEDDPGPGTALVLYFCKAEAPGIADIHRLVVQNLECRAAVRAPNRYVRVSTGYESESLTRHDAEILERGTGRT